MKWALAEEEKNLEDERGIYVDKLIDVNDVQPWAEDKDRLITKLATFVIAASAGTACLSLIAKTVFPSLGSVSSEAWEIDILTLSLVASLSFVMGSNGK